ncbi:uncharacterized protein KY384_007322 [Bacidia gigantensis]|uniref:uncharacterized protein n=1 Tax=Bacidia gigantensis TaxID=2732470 RepID=UPI001D03BD5F|nr:uncharacterized protein KY384_007322 [Bacidia gigantensis]KAG8528404.1 hypothetical protein KY384_007322 [Bacidia gigantensis]
MSLVRLRYRKTKGGFYGDNHELGISDSSERLCTRLLETTHMPPSDTIFEDDLFKEACQRLSGKNEARVTQDIARLLVSSAETLALRGMKQFNVLVESIRKLQPGIAEVMHFSYFVGIYYMQFPFLTNEVKCGASGLAIADRQNAHSMTLAVRGIVELFKLARKERELLTFSISHDDDGIRIHGYYPLYKHGLSLLGKIREVIDALPDDFDLEKKADHTEKEKATEPSRLSHRLDDHVPASEQAEAGVEPITPEASTQTAAKKKPKKG